MSASIRSIKEDTRQMIAEKVKQVIEHVCKVYDAEPNLNYIFSYPPVINHEAIAKLVMDSGAEVLGKDKVFSASMSSGSEDFAY